MKELKTDRVQIKIEPSVKAFAANQAEKDGRTMSNWIVELIKREMKVEKNMKKMTVIFSTNLEPCTETRDLNGNPCEWEWCERDIGEYSEQWNGDVMGYVKNLIENRADCDEGIEILEEAPITIHNEKPNALFLRYTCWEETVYEMYWAGEIDYEEHKDEMWWIDDEDEEDKE